MSLLEIDDMTQGFGEKMIFNHVTFRLQTGEHIGLVGANGQGKTTFMKLITNDLLPDDGRIQWGARIKIGYMDQNVELNHYNTVREVLLNAFHELYEMEAKMNEAYEEAANLSGGVVTNESMQTEQHLQKIMLQAAKYQDTLEQFGFYSINARIESVACGLGIDGLLEHDPQKLSGGQRTKVILAKLLLEEPDVLLLDEPTNHLDEENIEWLKQYLNSYKKAFIVISHDTTFMNDVIHVVYYLKNKVLTRYPGNYDRFLELYKEKEKATMSQFVKQQETIQKLETYIQKNKARASTAAQAKSREKQLNRITRIEIDKKLPLPHFNFQYGIEPVRQIILTKNLVIGYEKAFTKPLNLSVCRGDKIVLTGANGIGKTTLLKSLLGLIPSVSGSVEFGDHIQIGYYEQELMTIPETVVLNYVLEQFPDRLPKEVRSMLARCGLRTEHILNSFASLSGGEQSRARLCSVINHKTNVLFLDEPTNHLDQEAKDELKRALIEYPGTVILVSHEKDFYEGIGHHIWDCREFRV